MNTYSVKPCSAAFSLSGRYDSPEWHDANILTVSNFLPESSDHRPRVEVKLLYDEHSIRIFFKVTDKYVRATHTGYMAEVWKDSCVEWFVQPKPDKSYFNFEVSCGGNLYASYVENPRETDKKLRKATHLPLETCQAIGIFHSMPTTVEPEIADPVEWFIGLNIPVKTFEPFIGPVGNLRGQEWRANFYKCGDETSHPHWAAWSPVSELNFHRPQEFGTIRFLQTDPALDYKLLK
jgi:hypothetical protein